MNTLAVSTSAVNLFADEWDTRTVAQAARDALRRPGGIVSLIANLSARSYHPWNRNGQRHEQARIWVIEDAEGNVLAEEPSLYQAIHKLAH
jgi:hypothetical protein